MDTGKKKTTKSEERENEIIARIYSWIAKADLDIEVSNDIQTLLETLKAQILSELIEPDEELLGLLEDLSEQIESE